MEIGQTVAQGELTFERLPDTANMAGDPLTDFDGTRYIVGHSETGHHHVIEREGATITHGDRAKGILLANIKAVDGVTVDHLRTADTHKALHLPPGNYSITPAREYDPWSGIERRVAD